MGGDGPRHKAEDLRVKGELLFEGEGVPARAVAESGTERASSPTPGVIHLEAGVRERFRIGGFPGLVFSWEHKRSAAHGASSNPLMDVASIASTAWRYSLANHASVR